MVAILQLPLGDFMERTVDFIAGIPNTHIVRLGISLLGQKMHAQLLANRTHRDILAPLGRVKVGALSNTKIYIEQDLQSQFRWFSPR
ncbi:hypothetical protein [Xenorhabdus bharatensis]|uniref:hypothetical protein n=1 Tax=Xenorhabdus bharatensis TaxID=3136256 RepID=UPI0030F44021